MVCVRFLSFTCSGILSPHTGSTLPAIACHLIFLYPACGVDAPLLPQGKLETPFGVFHVMSFH